VTKAGFQNVTSRTAFYPGSFDPVTFGHLDIIARVARLCDRLVLGVGAHHGKEPLIPTPQRVGVLGEVAKPIADHAGIALDIVVFDGLAVDAARKAKAGLIVRGLRDATDFDYEVQMGQMNAALAPDIETVFLAASPATRMIASSLVKQIVRMGGDVRLFVPDASERAIRLALESSN
jgi:pantetheine-phosphate adenylyltransferase